MITGYLAQIRWLAAGASGKRGAGADMGNYGIGSIYHFPNFGLCGFNCRWFAGNGRCGGGYVDSGGMHPAVSLVFAFLAGMAAGFVTGFLHTALGIPGILASILTQISLYSVNLGIMGKANQSIGLTQRNLVASSRYVTADDSVFFL